MRQVEGFFKTQLPIAKPDDTPIPLIILSFFIFSDKAFLLQNYFY